MPINTSLVDNSTYSYDTYHPCNITTTFGDWRLSEDDVERVLNLKDIRDSITLENLKTVTLSEIAFKQALDPNKRGLNCPCCNGERYKNCKTQIPTILCEDGPNILGKRYRLLDGKHRVQKLIDEGKLESKAFVIKYEDIKQHFLPVWRGHLRRRRREIAPT